MQLCKKIDIADYRGRCLTKRSSPTHYSALFQCADIFTLPKRAVMGGLAQRQVAMKDFAGFGWSIELLPGWIGEHSDPSTIYTPDGVGALQISAYGRDSEITEVDLQELASEHIESGARTKEIACGDFLGITLAFGVDGEFWRCWYVANGRLALFVSYNCNEDDRDVEAEEIKQMLASLAAT